MRPKIEIFKVKRTTATSCPAFGGQHMFFYLDRDAPNHPVRGNLLGIVRLGRVL